VWVSLRQSARKGVTEGRPRGKRLDWLCHSAAPMLQLGGRWAFKPPAYCRRFGGVGFYVILELIVEAPITGPSA
jgi:hypothetical protein